MAIRVLLVDDQQLVRAGFRLILETEPDVEVVGEAGDGRAGVELARRLQPDVVLMDIRMPDLDGVEATRLLAASGSAGPKVLILTTYDADEYVVEALRAGALGTAITRLLNADNLPARPGLVRSQSNLMVDARITISSWRNSASR